MRTLIALIVTAGLLLVGSPATAGIYTTTYVTTDGRMIVCTTITDAYGNPISVNCIGG